VAPAGAPGSRLTGVVVAVVIVVALDLGREVLVPITIAFLLTFVLSPLVELLRRIRLGRILSVVLSVILALGIILALGTAIGAQVADLAQDLPRYQATIETKVGALRNRAASIVAPLLGSLHHALPNSATEANPAQAAPATNAPRVGPQPVPVVVEEPTPSAFQISETVLRPILNPLATFGIIVVVTIFALLQKDDLRDRAIRLFGASDLSRTTLAMNEAGRRLVRYFLTQLAINTSFGVIVATGLYFIGVPNPLLWGISGALLRFIPYIGSWIAAVLPVGLAAATEPGWTMAIWTVALYAATEFTMGQLVEPLVYGHSTGLSPFAVIVAAIFWAWLWGPIGLIISTPLTLCMVVLGRHVARLEFLDVLLGDQPALSPVENFYQRMLANDPDDALDQAEVYLKARSLMSYYDDVALKGLQLAARDVQRGSTSRVRTEQLRENIKELVRELGDYEGGTPVDEPTDARAKPEVAGAVPASATARVVDKTQLPQAWQHEQPVLCIAGRGPLDEAASSMLAQLLERQGLGARSVPYEAVSRENIASLDVANVAMACVSYLDIRGHPAHLRHLLRRLRTRLPDIPLLVGLWPAQEPILGDSDLRREVGATYCVSTLREAVAACIDAATTSKG
jgi:predicted PurR-regulated permease PerM